MQPPGRALLNVGVPPRGSPETCLLYDRAVDLRVRYPKIQNLQEVGSPFPQLLYDLIQHQGVKPDSR
jgi:hypothetical protein